MTEYVKKSDVLELLSLPKDLIAEYVCDLKGLWIDDDEAEQTEPNCSEIPNNCEPKICDTCRYYNSNIPCGSTPSACKEADKFAKEFVDGLKKLKQTAPTISKMEQVEDEPQMNPCDGCVCDDGKHLMYCMNCKGIAWKTEPPKVEDVPKAGMSDMSEIDKMIKMVDGILGDDDLYEGCEYVIEGLSCDECRRKYADKIIKILRNVKRKPQTCRNCRWSQTVCKIGDNPPCHSYEPKDEPQTKDEILREQCRAFIDIVEQIERSE